MKINTYCSVKLSRQIFSMHSLKDLSEQNSFGRVGEELTLSIRKRMMNIIAKIAKNVVDILFSFSNSHSRRTI